MCILWIHVLVSVRAYMHKGVAMSMVLIVLKEQERRGTMLQEVAPKVAQAIGTLRGKCRAYLFFLQQGLHTGFVRVNHFLALHCLRSPGFYFGNCLCAKEIKVIVRD